LIDNKQFQERKEFFSVLAGVIAFFVIFILIYALNGWVWTDTTDSGFCEATRESWIREPVNTLSNLAFVFVGLYILWLAKDDPIGESPSLSTRSWFLIMYAISCVAVGVGSFAWHGFNTSWGNWLDVTGMMMYITIPVFYNFAKFFKWTERDFCTYYLGTNALLSILLWQYSLLQFLWGLSIGIWLVQELSLKYQKQPFVMFIVPTLILLVLFLYTSPNKSVLDFITEEFEAVVLWAFFAFFLHNIEEIKIERTHYPYFWAGFASYIIATIIWEPSRTGGPLCSPDSPFQGHAAWHFLGAIAMWCFYNYFRTEKDNY